MKISKLEVRLREIREEYGDLEILGEGHPGEVGQVLESEGIMVDEFEQRFDDDPEGKVLFFHW